MARGCIIKKCSICGRKAQSSCTHKEARYAIIYPVGSKRRWETVGPNRHEAERRLAQVLSELNGGTYFSPNPILFSEFGQKWLRDYAALKTKPSTYETYRLLIEKRFNPLFGHLPMTQITTRMIEGFLAASVQERGLAPKSANNSLILLSTILKCAKRWEYLKQNPAEGIKRLPIPPREMDFLTPDEIRLLLQHSDEPYRSLFLTAILTGMRQGELLGLQWGDIDFVQNRIQVKRSLWWRARDDVKDPKEPTWIFVTPKSHYSRRSIALSPKLKETLELHKINGSVSPHDLVFCNRSGGPLEPRYVVKHQFFPALTRAGLRQIRFHDLRHTFATLMIHQGENVKFVQNQMGHASVVTTLNVYGHLMPETHKEAGAKLDKQIFGLVSANVAQTRRAQTGQNGANEGKLELAITHDDTNG